MPYTFRTFILDHAGSIHPCSPSGYSRLASGALALPRFANQSVRSAHIAVEHERGRPTGWLHEDFLMLSFDAHGTLERGAARLRVRLALTEKPDLEPLSPARRDAVRRAIQSLAAPTCAAWHPTEEERLRIRASLRYIENHR